MLKLFVLDAQSNGRIPAVARAAEERDLLQTKSWQTDWTSEAALEMPNKVALCRADDGELLGLMSYEVDRGALAVEVIYLESARHSNANLLHTTGEKRKYFGVARALLAYAIQISMDSGFDGVLIFKAKTSELLKYYMETLGARQVAAYDPFRLVLWEDAAEKILADYQEG